MANATVFVGIAILALVFVATVLSVVFATRGAMATNSDVVSVLHFVGAEDGFIAREFQRHFLLLGLRGGLVGAATAAVLFALLGFLIAPSMATPETDQVSALFGRFAVGPVGYFGALGIAFLIAVMTALTSRTDRLPLPRGHRLKTCREGILPSPRLFLIASSGRMSEM